MCWKFRKFKGHGIIINEITLHFFPVATYILQSRGVKSPKAGMFLRVATVNNNNLQQLLYRKYSSETLEINQVAEKTQF